MTNINGWEPGIKAAFIGFMTFSTVQPVNWDGKNSIGPDFTNRQNFQIREYKIWQIFDKGTG